MTCPICGSKLKDDARFCSSCGANTASAATGRLLAGRILAGRYQIVRLLARGGMGAVYLAVDTRLDGAQVAVKEMAGVYRPGETDAFAQAVAEFRREAALLARLSHPNLPRVIDRFEQDGKQFLVMEYVEGQTLRQALNARGGRAEVAEVLAWAEQLCAVLAYLHAQNPPIIYRDLKPGNVMLRPDGRVALIDFGIARFYKPGKASDTVIYGTLGYAAPEQYGEGQTDQRSDIYALGVLLYHALTGYDVAGTPFRLPDLSRLRPDVPIPLANLIARATALEPADRFASATEVADALLRARLADEPPGQAHEPAPALPAQRRTRGLPLWIFGALLALLVALAAGMALGRTPGEATHAGVTQAPAATAVSSVAGQVITATAVPEPDPPRDMVRVPAGSFTMGSDDDQTARPAHVLDLPAFLIDRTEVTNRAYRACVLVQVCQPPQRPSSLTHEHYYDSADFDTYPVVYVTWEDAQTYCAWRGRRLPTEAEWEKAARGADGRLFPWGDDWDEARAWITGGDDASRDLAPVGSIPQNASPYGALDMSGNAWEWTSSRDLPYPYAGGDGREARATAGQRVIRGGAWGHDPRNARVTTRDPKDPREGFWNRGFRCARSQAN